MYFRLTLLLLLVNWAAVAIAAPPKLDFLFPAGAQPGTTTTVTVYGTFEKWPPQVWCDRPDITIAAAAEKGKLAVTVPAYALPGICWLRLYDAEGATLLRPFILGMIPEVIETEPNNEFSKAQVLDSAHVTVNGQLDKLQDVDCFAVPLKQGQTLVASLEAHRTLGSPMDGVLQIVSLDGFVLERNDDDHGLDPQIVFLAPADRTYVVRALAFPAEANSNMALAGAPNYVYRLTLTTGPFVDHVWPNAASSSGPAETRIFGWNIPDALQRLPLIVAPGKPVVTLFAPELANFITIPVEPHAVVVENQPAGPREPQELQSPVTLTGRIEEVHEVDAYRVALRKGEAIHIRVEAREFGSPLDPVLTVVDAAGKTLQSVDDVETSRDAELTFAAPADGQYKFTIADLHRRGGWRFVYRLTLTRPQPDFQASVAAETFVLTTGKPLEILVAITRAGGFAEEIEFALVGLPAGILAVPVKSSGQGDTAKSVKLVLAGAAAPWSGPIHITGQSAGEAKLSHKAQAPIAGLTARTTNLWLTVVAAPAQK